MLPDLERLIHLHDIDIDTERRRRWVADLPAALAALDARLDARRTALEREHAVLADNQVRRRALEKDLAVVQARLSKFKDQLMEVKTNKEYLAMQHEIAMAQDGVRILEDQILELLVDADDISARIKAAETALAADQKSVEEERRSREQQRGQVDRELAELATARAAVERELSPPYVALFNTVSLKHRGSAIVEARDGHCTACFVRLRPQIANEIRRGDRVIQCESCGRILYLAPAPAQPASDGTPAPAGA
jgi:predicted  nucleic acid-binding Zn-ribbon protein